MHLHSSNLCSAKVNCTVCKKAITSNFDLKSQTHRNRDQNGGYQEQDVEKIGEILIKEFSSYQLEEDELIPGLYRIVTQLGTAIICWKLLKSKSSYHKKKGNLSHEVL